MSSPVSSASRVGPVLALLAVLGYFLGGCGGDGGGGGALSGLSDLSGSRPDVTLPTRSAETDTATEPMTETLESTSTTAPATTTGATDTGAEEPPSEGGRIGAWIALALAAARGETTTVEVTTTEAAPTTEEAPTTTDVGPLPIETVDPEPASSDSGTPWGWIVGLGLALAAVVAGLVVWRRRRAGTG